MNAAIEKETRVMFKLGYVIAGFLIGAVILGPAPVEAQKTTVKTLERRVVALEGQVKALQSQASANPTAGLQERIKGLEELTQLLDADGTYQGYVNAVQIWSHYCSKGDNAKWEDYDGYIELSCSAGGEGAKASGGPEGSPFEGTP
jgi:hypothetical protein